MSKTFQFPVYQIDFSAVASGKHVAASKRRIRWRFGFPNLQALNAGRTGTDCRGEEHEVVITWSVTSGKRQVLMDGKEIHYASSRTSVLDHSWSTRGNHVMKVICHAAPPMSPTPGFRQYDMLIDGQSFFTMPKVYELGIRGITDRGVPRPGRDYAPAPYDYNNQSSMSPPRPNPSIPAPRTPQEEEEALQRAINESLAEAQTHLERRGGGGPSDSFASPPGATAAGGGGSDDNADLLDFDGGGAIDNFSSPPPPPTQQPYQVPAPPPYPGAPPPPQAYQSYPTTTSYGDGSSNYAAYMQQPQQQQQSGSYLALPAPPGSVPPPPAAGVASPYGAPPYGAPPPQPPPNTPASAYGAPPPQQAYPPASTDASFVSAGYDDPFAPKPTAARSGSEIARDVMSLYGPSPGGQSSTVASPAPYPASSGGYTGGGGAGYDTPQQNGYSNSSDDQNKPLQNGLASLTLTMGPLTIQDEEEDDDAPKTDVDSALKKLVNFDHIDQPAEEKLKLTMKKEEDKKASKHKNKSTPKPPVALNQVGSAATLEQIKSVKGPETNTPKEGIMKAPPTPWNPNAPMAGAMVMYGQPLQGPPPIQPQGFGAGAYQAGGGFGAGAYGGQGGYGYQGQPPPQQQQQYYYR